MTARRSPESVPPGPGGESFEVVEVDCRPYLTDEQKAWPVRAAAPRPEPTEVVEVAPAARPVLAVTVPGPGGGELTDDVLNLLLRASREEQALGGRGLTLAGRRADGRGLTLTLAPVAADPGAEARLRAVAAELNRTAAGLTAEVRPAA